MKKMTEINTHSWQASAWQSFWFDLFVTVNTVQPNAFSWNRNRNSFSSLRLCLGDRMYLECILPTLQSFTDQLCLPLLITHFMVPLLCRIVANACNIMFIFVPYAMLFDNCFHLTNAIRFRSKQWPCFQCVFFHSFLTIHREFCNLNFLHINCLLKFDKNCVFSFRNFIRF